MKKFLLTTLAVVCLVAGASAQRLANGSLTAAAASCTSSGPSCVIMTFDPSSNDAGAIGIDISSIPNATAVFEASFDGKAIDDSTKTWRSASVTPVASTTTVTSTTSAGAWRVAVSGMTDFRVRCSVFVAGPVVLTIRSSQKAASIGGGGVSFTSGGTSANVLPKSNGSSGLQDSSITDDGTKITTTEPVGLPDGAAGSASLNWNVGQGSNLGFYRKGANLLALSAASDVGTLMFDAGNGIIKETSAGVFGWAASGSDATTLDTGISRGTAGVVDFGTGAAASTAGTANLSTIQYRGLAQTYFVTSNFTSAANTNLQAITGLAWTFPASTAMNVAFECHLLYSQATATAAIDFGVQDVTVAPTSASFSAMDFSNTTVVNEGTLQNLASTTATSVVSISPSAITTIWQAHMFGFIEQPSNASTSVFQIMIKTANSADLPTVYRGSYCRLQQ